MKHYLINLTLTLCILTVLGLSSYIEVFLFGWKPSLEVGWLNLFVIIGIYLAVRYVKLTVEEHYERKFASRNKIYLRQ